jgi:hypothetical protein
MPGFHRFDTDCMMLSYEHLWMHVVALVLVRMVYNKTAEMTRFAFLIHLSPSRPVSSLAFKFAL